MILLIDNYDSFTYNLVRYFEELNAPVKVVKNDELSAEQLAQQNCSHLVISPGPCTPNESGISQDAIAVFAGKIPILGVCLGHQTIAQVYGADVRRADKVLHGKTSVIHVDKSRSVLFKGCPNKFVVTRYHSLLVDNQSLDKRFVVSALTDDNEIMAIESTQLRLYGVQYHPESLLTEFGHRVLKNFLLKG